MQRERLAYLLIPVAAFLAVVPLLMQGCSCGHDFDFHILSWMEAARQFSRGTLHPQWAYTPAYNAGEPRFVFYPPVSWTIGAILGLVMPWTWTPIAYTWLALTSSGLAMRHLARRFTAALPATVAAVLYTVNPYMLFTAYERTAYAELLAAAWIPLLLAAILRRRPTMAAIAVPVALLWLTNAPAAVMSCYAVALVTFVRLIAPSRSTEDEARSSRLALVSTVAGGTLLGLALAAVYIVPAAFERRFVQVNMAILPGMRIEDNFLFHHTGDGPHDLVLHTASVLAVMLLTMTAVLLGVLAMRWRRRDVNSDRVILPLAVLAGAIAVLLTPPALFVWKHTPDLMFLQFPWRLLAILGAILGLATAMAVNRIRLRAAATLVIVLLVAVPSLVFVAYRPYHQECDPEDTVAARLALFHSSQGTDPTDEYTPRTADNDSLSHADPPFWLSRETDGKPPRDAVPGSLDPDIAVDSPISQNLILNLRDYPAWRVQVNGQTVSAREQRDDGLIEIPVAAGHSFVTVAYVAGEDEVAGAVVSLCTVPLLLLALRRRSSRTSGAAAGAAFGPDQGS